MSAKKKPSLVLELGEKGGPLEFQTPDELQQWLAEEISKWQWMRKIPQCSQGPAGIINLQGGIAPYIQQWRELQSDVEAAQDPIRALKNTIEANVNGQSFWLSSSEKGGFLLSVLEKRGPTAAAGAYVSLGGTYSPQNQPIHPQYIDGVIDAFLFRNEIDWTATVHREALEKLKSQYAGNIADQKKKAEQLAESNEILNVHFSKTLKEKKEALDSLHASQTQEFADLLVQHENNLKAIEVAYDQKLALLKPVQYWNARRKAHNKKAKKYAIASAIAGLLLFLALGGIAYDLFLNVPAGEQPKPWQVGVFAVAAFFAIWFERILVRLFVSNMHLGTDAEERVTMLQTYLSIIREGSDFAPEDKKLILERLFYPAADGLVKDDAAPPTFLEFLSRK